VIELSSTNWLLIGLAAAAALAIGGLFLVSERDTAFEVTSETAYAGFGAGAFGEPSGSASCSASCEEAASCSDASDCSGNCADTRGTCAEEAAGACNGLAQGETCDGSGARDGTGRGRCQN